jgi:prepilin-type N-terminal cleavage/methylation domain-containing protein
MNRIRSTADSGITLIEVVVALSIMSVLMAAFTAGIIQMYRSANASESLSRTQSQLNVTFLRLDKEIRYASAINDPSGGPDYYVEYLTTNAGSPQCQQLRLGVDGKLRLRSWPNTSPATASGWTTLASGVSSVGTPFALVTEPKSSFERLRLNLVARPESGGTATSARLDVTFTALNAVGKHQTVCGGRRP